jgi:hypothetical protein
MVHETKDPKTVVHGHSNELPIGRNPVAEIILRAFAEDEATALTRINACFTHLDGQATYMNVDNNRQLVAPIRTRGFPDIQLETVLCSGTARSKVGIMHSVRSKAELKTAVGVTCCVFHL